MLSKPKEDVPELSNEELEDLLNTFDADQQSRRQKKSKRVKFQQQSSIEMSMPEDHAVLKSFGDKMSLKRNQSEKQTAQVNREISEGVKKAKSSLSEDLARY